MAIFGFGKKKPADVVPMPGADGVQPEQFQGNVAFDKPVMPNKIGKEQVAKAAEILQKYKKGKANLEKRIIENEQWYKMRHWEQIRGNKAKDTDPEPASAWLFNSIANKHADIMDNFPEPNVLPREDNDKEAAKQLSAILPVVLERNDFEQTYSEASNYKLKSGTGVYGVFWNPSLENGLGDIDIKQIDILNIFWEPGIKDIQKSRNLFLVELVDNDILEQQYPDQLKGRLGTSSLEISKYIYDDTVDTAEKSAVVDWYYKVQVPNEYGSVSTVLHYCKFVNDEVLYASENDPDYAERGFYDHGEYPFEFDPLFTEEGTPCGFGYIDIMKDAQLYIDKLNQAIIKNALAAMRRRYFVKINGSINEGEYADLSKDFVHVDGGNLDDGSIREIQVEPLNPLYVEIMKQKVDELKETPGNRDFSQGGTTSGVTAASAIAALQEAGSKLSRDMIKGSYRAFQKINYFCLELIRQFYDEPRCFRITGEMGEQEFIQFNNAAIRQQPQGQAFGSDMGERKPVFDIKITSQKSSPFSKIAQNELAKEMYGAGFFRPELADQALIAIDMMDFEGKDTVEQKVAQNGTLLQMVQALQMQMQKMAVLVDNAYGSNITQSMMAEMGAQGGQPLPPSGAGGANVQTNALGDAFKSAAGTTAGTAKQRAMNVSTPKS